MRDNQKSRLYAAERMAFGSVWEIKPDFKTLKECEEFLAKVFAHKVFQRHYPMADGLNILLRPGKRARRAYAGTHEMDGVTYDSITLPRWARRKWVILHELSHHLTKLTTNSDFEPHGYQFANIYLDLVGRHIGIKERRELKHSYVAKKVRTWEKKPSAHTDEHRQMLSERMKRINEARVANKPIDPLL